MLAVAGVVHEDVDPAVDLQGSSRRAFHLGFGGAGIECVRLGPAQRRGDFGGITCGSNNLGGWGGGFVSRVYDMAKYTIPCHL